MRRRSPFPNTRRGYDSEEEFVKFVPRHAGGTRAAAGPIIIGVAILVALALALAWRYTPLGDIVTPKSTIAFAESLADYWWAPLALILSYTPATVVMFPRWLITLAAVAIFGPWPAFAYAELGVLLAALCGYVAGGLVGLDTVRRMAGPRLNPLRRLLRRRGLIAVTMVRLVPWRRSSSSTSRWAQCAFGSITTSSELSSGMLPGMLATTVLGDQITDWISELPAATCGSPGRGARARVIAFAGQRWLRHHSAVATHAD
jgi:uncharacterized membrane protein YdjX (TVP38/TMEM64 family)